MPVAKTPKSLAFAERLRRRIGERWRPIAVRSVRHAGGLGDRSAQPSVSFVRRAFRAKPRSCARSRVHRGGNARSRRMRAMIPTRCFVRDTDMRGKAAWRCCGHASLPACGDDSPSSADQPAGQAVGEDRPERGGTPGGTSAIAEPARGGSSGSGGASGSGSAGRHGGIGRAEHRAALERRAAAARQAAAASSGTGGAAGTGGAGGHRRDRVRQAQTRPHQHRRASRHRASQRAARSASNRTARSSKISTSAGRSPCSRTTSPSAKCASAPATTIRSATSTTITSGCRRRQRDHRHVRQRHLGDRVPQLHRAPAEHPRHG